MRQTSIFESPVGRIHASAEDDRLCAIRIDSGRQATNTANNPALTRLQAELQDYFNRRGSSFTVPHVLPGTEFQQRVWRALLKIPHGKTMTYGQLAKRLHSSPRAVGGACRANPLPIIIPCHRVVAKQGIGGYDGRTAGKRLDIKRWLLRHEGVEIV